MRVERVADPEIVNPRDAVVRITSTAICGSDLHLYNGYVPTKEKGDILGHEFMGEVVEVGRAVKNLKPLLERVQKGEIDPSFVVTHRLSLDEAPEGYDMFLKKEDDCMKVVLSP